MKSLIIKPILQLALFGVLGVIAMGVASDDQTWKKADVSNLETEWVLELKVDIGATETIGDSDLGVRRFIPITGGTFAGKGIAGTVLSGGADWQLQRPDGVLEIKAIYAIKTNDGVTIAVDNRGIIVPPNVSGEKSVYVRSAPKFQAPKGKYDWLNKRIFNGTITPSPNNDYVIIRVFEVK